MSFWCWLFPNSPRCREPEPPQPEPEPEPCPDCGPPPPFQNEVDKCYALVSKERAAAGVAELDISECLEDQAQGHADWMSDTGRMTHNGWELRLRNCGHRRGGSENVGLHHYSAQSAMYHNPKGWMNSPGHKRNILDPKWRTVGIGYSEERGAWCQLFAP